MAQKCKEIKFINYVIIDGAKIPMSTLSEEDKKNIAVQLNDRAMNALGYVRTEETA